MNKNIRIDLVPKTCWYTNVRSNVSKSEWDIIRRKVYRKANYKCEICGGKGDKHPVEAHEIWTYDDINKIQSLKEIISVCPNCHKFYHIGLASINGEYESTLKHLSKITGLSIFEAEEYIHRMFIIWRERSKHQWKLDISMLRFYLEMD
jgi:hypothetical protein